MDNAIAPTSGITIPAVESPERALLRNNRYFLTIIILIVVGSLCLVVVEQIAAGWLALGDRANISRRDLNGIEITVMIGMAAWGVICLVTAWGFYRHPSTPSLGDYLVGRIGRTSAGVFLTLAFLFVLIIGCLLFCEQILTGWIALGERVNISRRDINATEWIAVISSVIWALVSLRAFLFLLQRNKRGWAWAQWTALLTGLVGFTVFFAALVHLNEIVPPGGTLTDNVAGTLELMIPGLLAFLSAMAVYRYLTLSVNLSADQSVRNSLAKSPSAGAIIGLITLIVAFSIVSPLFLEPRAAASALSTNITNGIVAIGITLLMISGEFDLSVGSIFGVSSLVFILAMTEGVFGLPPQSAVTAAIMSLILAAFLGFINGIILILTKIPSFIVTLATLLMYRAVIIVVIPEGRIIRYADYDLPEPIIDFSPYVLIALLAAAALVLVWFAWRQIPRLWGSLRRRIASYSENTSDFRDIYVITTFLWALLVTIALAGLLIGCVVAIISLFGRGGELIPINFFDIVNGRIESLPLIGPLSADINLRTGVIWWFVLVIVFQFILTQMPYGGFSFAVGGNAGAARAQGISVSRVKIFNFMICALLCGVAGLAFVSRVGSVGPNLGEGLELEVIAAAVIGGALLSGGYGSIFGALLGVLLFGLLRTGLVLAGVPAQIFYGMQGLIILLAVVLNTAVRRVRT